MFEQVATAQLYAWLLVFCRIGSGIMVLPGIGEVYVAARSRLLFALAFSLLMSGIVAPVLPPLPSTPVGVIELIVKEIIIGIFIGTISRVIISSIHMAGQIISMQASLSAAQMFDPNQGGQGTVLGNLLSVFAVVLMFAADIHHLMLEGLYESYALFVPGYPLLFDDMARTAARVVSGAFTAAFKLSSGFIVFGLILYLAGGILARLMPTLQIFFLIMAPQILLSFALLMFTFSAMMTWYLDYLGHSLPDFYRGAGHG